MQDEKLVVGLRIRTSFGCRPVIATDWVRQAFAFW